MSIFSGIFLAFDSGKSAKTMAIAKRTPQKSPEKQESILKRAFTATWVQFITTTTIHGELCKKKLY